MTDHETTRDALLMATNTDELSPEARTHLASCETCSALAASLEELDAGLVAFADIEVPDGLLERTMHAIDAERASVPQAAPPPFSAMGLLAGLLEAIFVGLFAWPAAALVSLRSAFETRREAKARSARRARSEETAARQKPSRPSASNETGRAPSRPRWPLLLGLPAGAATVACLGLGTFTWGLTATERRSVIASAGAGSPMLEQDAPPPAATVQLDDSQSAGFAYWDEPSEDAVPSAEEVALPSSSSTRTVDREQGLRQDFQGNLEGAPFGGEVEANRPGGLAPSAT
ncbi:MAG: hypothetical protein AB8I08_02190 [Sandaracinaceae bacterium]